MIGMSLIAAFALAGPNHAARVSLSAQPEPSSRLAATELTNYVRKVTGVVLPVTEGGVRTGSVVIGTLASLGDAVPAGIRAALDARDEEEAYWIGTEDGSLWLVGKNETGELRGVYRLLESRLGVRWFKVPTEDDPGEYVPKSTSVVLDDFAECRGPRFAIRRLDQTGSWASHIPVRGMTLANRLGFQTYPSYGGRIPFEDPSSRWCQFFAPRLLRRNQPHGGGHNTIIDAVPAEKYFATHPEYFALVDGKRVNGSCYCLTNPDLVRLTAEHFIRQFRQDGGLGQMHFGQVDMTHGWCECDACLAASGSGTKRDDISVVFAKFVRQVADRIWEACPEARLSVWAYSTYRQYPGFEHDPRMQVWYTTHGRCHGHALDDPNCYRNVKISRDIETWHSPGRKIFFYDYLTCAPLQYGCAEEVEAHDIRYYDKMGYVGWKNEAPFSDARYNRSDSVHPEIFPSNWQWLYVVGHMLWDPSLDWRELVADAESKYYGVAYPAMREYHAERRRLWRSAKQCVGYPFGDTRSAVLLEEAGAQERLLTLLDRAAKLAADDAIVLGRVKLDRRWLEKYWIKPHDQYRVVEASALKVPKANAVPTVDGVGDEEVWKTAAVTDDFRGTPQGFGAKKPKIDERLRTEVRILRDEANFYLLMTVREPKLAELKFSPLESQRMWGEEHMEVIFYPPVIDCRYYQLGFDPEGKVLGLSGPGNIVTDYGVTSCAKKTAEGYVVEAKIPNRKIHAFVPGERWRVMFGRYRAMIDEILPHHWQRAYSVGGCSYQDTTSYTPVDIVE